MRDSLLGGLGGPVAGTAQHVNGERRSCEVQWRHPPPVPRLAHPIIVSEGSPDGGGIDRHVVYYHVARAMGRGGGGDPVAGLASAALGAAEARHARGAASSLANELAAVPLRDAVG